MPPYVDLVLAGPYMCFPYRHGKRARPMKLSGDDVAYHRYPAPEPAHYRDRHRVPHSFVSEAHLWLPSPVWDQRVAVRESLQPFPFARG
jgi:hypothetical protein